MRQHEKMKVIRQYRGLTQKEVAERMGSSVQNYSQYETGKRRPSRAVLEKIASALECDISEIADEVTMDGRTPVPASPFARRDLMIDKFMQLNDEGQEKAIEQINLLLKIPEYNNHCDNVPIDDLLIIAELSKYIKRVKQNMQEDARESHKKSLQSKEGE